MKYYVMAEKSDDTNTEASLDDWPKDFPIKKFKFSKGDLMIPQITEPLKLQFSDDYPDGRKLIDMQHTSMGLKIISLRFKELLKDEVGIEFIPITLLDHQGKVASEDYTIANFLRCLDCLDREFSEVEMNPINPNNIYSISKLVLDESTIPDDVNIFRVKQCMTTIIVKEPLKEKIEAAGMDGPLFVPVEEFDSALYLGV